MTYQSKKLDKLTTFKSFYTAAITAAVLHFCSIASAQTPSAPATPALVAAHYSVLVHATYEDTLVKAREMQAAITAFSAAPSADALGAARKSWLAARELYGQTEVFRFYGGPIDNKDGPEGRINAWPMDESYVDYVVGKKNAGFINNRKQAITKKTLTNMNERGGEENIATGWHAIEFMLWGQDLSETGPGNRSFEDFVDGKTPNADRRRQYLAVVSDLLIDDLSGLLKAWAPAQKANYRTNFEKGGNESLRKIFVSLGSLSRGELAGERLEVALASKDQEDEHSCFSDNTHRDAATNAKGIENVWLGRFTRANGTVLQGPALRDLVAIKNSAMAEKLTQQISLSAKAAADIPAPFDRAIASAKDSPARMAIQKTISSLTEQSKQLVDAAAAVGITKLTLVRP